MSEPNSPALLILVGLPGSGKTTLSTWLRSRVNFTVVSRDAIRTAMFQECQYTVGEKAAAFRAMKEAIAVSLSMGLTVCTDGIAFSRHQDLDEMVAIGADAGARVRIYQCCCPVELAQERVERDRLMSVPNNPSDRTAELVSTVAAAFEPVPASAIDLDMTRPVDEIGATVLRYLEYVP